MRNSRPHIVIIVLDAVRSDHLSCYGYKRETTPAIDQLAREGIQFSRAHTVAPWTLPSHASLFTGLYPSQHRADWDTKWLSSKHLTLAQYLKSFGYRCASFSCNSFISPYTNLTHGFDVDIQIGGLMGGGSRLVQKTNGSSKRSLVQRAIRQLHRRWRLITRLDRGATAATNHAIRWLRQQGTVHPSFTFINFMECHLTYMLRYPDRFKFVEPQEYDRARTVPQDAWEYMTGSIDISDEDMQLLQKLYDGGLYYMDRKIAALVDELKSLGIYDNTIFVVTADHGENFGNRGLMDHQYSIHESVAHVPLVIRTPDQWQSDMPDDRLVMLIDLFPTLADSIRAEKDTLPATSGQSLRQPHARKEGYIEYLAPVLSQFSRRYPDVDQSQFKSRYRGIYHNDHKLILRDDGRYELYDLSQDPHEQHDLAESQTDYAQQLVRRVMEHLGDWPVLQEATGENNLVAIEEQLKALGYL